MAELEKSFVVQLQPVQFLAGYQHIIYGAHCLLHFSHLVQLEIQFGKLQFEKITV